MQHGAGSEPIGASGAPSRREADRGEGEAAYPLLEPTPHTSPTHPLEGTSLLHVNFLLWFAVL